MTVKNLLSVIIPAYDAAFFIGQAIESVLAQAYQPTEIIVIDDGSRDKTLEIAASFGSPVTCHRQENAGPALARNRGLAMASGEYIGFLDADDLYELGCVELQIDKLRQNPSADVVIGRLTREELASRAGEPMIFRAMETPDQITLHLGACIFRQRVFEQVGLMDKHLRQTDDWDWFMRARELGVPMLLHENIVLRQRFHLNNITRDRATNMHYLSIMLKRSLDRRRAASGSARTLPDLASYHENETPTDQGEK